MWTETSANYMKSVVVSKSNDKAFNESFIGNIFHRHPDHCYRVFVQKNKAGESIPHWSLYNTNKGYGKIFQKISTK